eukprot:UN00222
MCFTSSSHLSFTLFFIITLMSRIYMYKYNYSI